jgi:hypothetical protein
MLIAQALAIRVLFAGTDPGLVAISCATHFRGRTFPVNRNSASANALLAKADMVFINIPATIPIRFACARTFLAIV